MWCQHVASLILPILTALAPRPYEDKKLKVTGCCLEQDRLPAPGSTQISLKACSYGVGFWVFFSDVCVWRGFLVGFFFFGCFGVGFFCSFVF